MALSAISLLWITERARRPWSRCSCSASAGTSRSSPRPPSSPTSPSRAERGKLLGFNDLLAGLTGAGLALLGGVALTALGVAALAIGGAALVAAPALWILRSGTSLTAASAGST